MRVLFCNIAWMKEYRGIIEGVDEPVSSAEYVKQNKDAHEAYNFAVVNMPEVGDVCLGYFSTKRSNGQKDNKLHIERIEGVSRDDDFADDVLVIWCAPQVETDNRTVVVGWYKHATVCREYERCEFTDGYIQYYNVIAYAENCFLLPAEKRNRYTLWNVPRRRGKGMSFGFGQSNQWYASEPEAQDFVKNLVENIENYTGENAIVMPE